MNIWFIIIACLLIIAIVVSATFLGYYYHTFNECDTYANIWCWDDFSCPYSPQCQPGQTDYKTCWPGVTAIYAPISSTCIYPETGGLPDSCVCSAGWQASGATCPSPA